MWSKATGRLTMVTCRGLVCCGLAWRGLPGARGLFLGGLNLQAQSRWRQRAAMRIATAAGAPPGSSAHTLLLPGFPPRTPRGTVAGSTAAAAQGGGSAPVPTHHRWLSTIGTATATRGRHLSVKERFAKPRRGCRGMCWRGLVGVGVALVGGWRCKTHREVKACVLWSRLFGRCPHHNVRDLLQRGETAFTIWTIL